MRHAVLIHGNHLQAEGWEQVVWGNLGDNLLGRVPQGVLVASATKAELIYWGTGASEKDGRKESEVTFDLALEQHLDLAKLCGKEDAVPNENMFLEWMQRVSFIDTVTQNTKEEIRRCAELCLERDIEQLMLVTSPFHAMRSLATGLSVLGADPRFDQLRRSLLVSASDTNPPGISVDDVVIIEPPHRGDMPKVPFQKNARRIFSFLKKPDVAFAFNDAWGRLIAEYEKQM